MEQHLSYLSDTERLKAYNVLTQGCMHLWSKNKIQEEKLKGVLDTFANLAEKDPLFLAHFTSYVIKKSDSKDLKVLATFANSISDADGTPFSPGSKYKKPNWRVVSSAALQTLDPKLTLRVLQLANSKRAFGTKPVATHFSKHLRSASQKYLRYREANPKSLEGIRKSGLSKTMQNIYRLSHTAPQPDAVRILGWKQKAGYPGANVELKKGIFDFQGMNDIQIAQKIQSEKLPPLTVLGALPKKITPILAAAILEQCSGEQAVILTDMFEQEGLLKIPEVQKVYADKLATAKNALDRVERFNTELTEETQQALKSAKSEVHKNIVGDIGKIFMHLDISGSMERAIEIAKNCGSIVAECVKHPEDNFYWGAFNTSQVNLIKPKSFEKDAFKAALYGLRASGGTHCLAWWEHSRKLGVDVDFFVTDQGNTYGDMDKLIKSTIQQGYKMPSAVVILDTANNCCKELQNVFERNNIPVAILLPEQLTESALVAQAVRTAVKGPLAIIEEIMKTPLLSIPKWWASVNA